MDALLKGETSLFAIMSGDRVFDLHIRCSNCLGASVRALRIPRGEEDAPVYVDELMDSAAVQNLPFRCGTCDNIIGQVVAVTGGD